MEKTENIEVFIDENEDAEDEVESKEIDSLLFQLRDPKELASGESSFQNLSKPLRS